MNKTIRRLFCIGLTAALGISTTVASNVKAAELRYNGTNRIETAIKIAQKGWPGKTDYAFIAAADDSYLIDSLIAAPLAKAYNAPILENYKGDKLDAEVFELLKQWGVSKVFLVSSDKVLKKGIVDELTGAGISVERLGQASNVETSLNVANALKEKLGSLDGVFIASNDSNHIVDALSIASIAGIKNMPILLSTQNTLPSDVKSFISKNEIQKCYAVGGSSVLSDNVIKDANAIRLSGQNRYETNIQVLTKFKDDLKFDDVYFSSGNDGHLVDALAGSVLAARNSSPILLVNDAINDNTKTFIKNNVTKKSTIEIFGGEGAVSSSAETNIDEIVYGETGGLFSVKYAKPLNSSLIAVTINHKVNALNTSNFKVCDGSENDIAVSSVALAPWDSNGRTVLVSLKSPVASGKFYTVNSVEFAGMNSQYDKPVVNSVKSTDYNKVEVSFSEPVKLDNIKVSITGKSSSTNLQVINKAYVNGNPDKIELTTSDQVDSVLYGVDISGASDFLGKTMDRDSSKTITGIGKDTTTKLSVKSVQVLTSQSLLVSFNTRVDTLKAIKAECYSLTEKYGSDASINIASARMAYSSEVGTDSGAAKKSVVLTLSESMKDTTVYNLAINGLTTSTGVGTDVSSLAFIGVGPFTSKMDMADDGNNVLAASNKKVKITFKRHMNTDLFIRSNFNITKVDDNTTLAIKSVNIVDDKNVELEVDNMISSVYKLTLTNLTDVDNNGFDTNKNCKLFEGMDKSSDITSIKSAALQSDNTALLLTFDSNVGANALDVTHYSINNGIGSPSKAELISGSPNMVKLTIPKTISGKIYNITVTGLENADGDVMSTSISSSFIGGGASATVPTVISAVAVDSHTIQITFDRSVKDSSIDGTGKIWISSTNQLVQGSILIKGKNTRQLDSNTNIYVYQSTVNDNMLVIRGGLADYVSGNANASGNFVLQIANTANTDAVTFQPNDGNMQGITITAVKALDKRTIRVTFDQAVKIENSATFAWVANSLAVANSVKVNGNAISNAFTLSKPTPVDSSYTAYDFLVSNDLAADNWLVVNPAITSLANGVHDYTNSDIGGFVTLADEDSLSSGIQQVREFAGSTADPGVISNIPVYMSDCKTIVINYPEAMNTVDSVNVASALNKYNYKLVDQNNNEISSNFLATHMCNLVYDSLTNKVIISLNTTLPSSNGGYYIQFANTLQNALGTRFVKKSVSDSSQVLSAFTSSTKQADKLKISTASYISSTKTLTIKLSEKATSLSNYDSASLLADFRITVVDNEGSSYDIKTSDIKSVQTNISDSYSKADDTITVILNSSINGTKTLKAGAMGTISLTTNNTLRGVNGEGGDSTSSIAFAQ
jgi:hypothetical protein